MSKSHDDVSKLGALGSGSTSYEFAEPTPDILETFPNKGTSLYLIKIAHPEFTSLCPKTGQPDFATIKVDYMPDKLCVETKSFKLYMVAYRNHHSFMESMANKIMEDLVSVLSPKYLRVVGNFNPRGGTYLTPTAFYVSPDVDRQELFLTLNLLERK
jgi:7-cyano-7-deazaguanine reductase